MPRPTGAPVLDPTGKAVLRSLIAPQVAREFFPLEAVSSRWPVDRRAKRILPGIGAGLSRYPGDVTPPLCRRSVLLHEGGTGRPRASATAAWHRRQLTALAVSDGRPCRSLPADRVECSRLSAERQSAGRNAELP